MEISLKKATLQKDLDTLFNLDVKSFNRPFDYPAKSKDDVTKYLGDAIIYLCYIKGDVVGSFSYKRKKDGSYDFLQMVVLPKYQGKGVGKYMTKKMLEKLKGKKVYTATHPLNIPAIILYLKNGFQIYGFKDNYYGDGEPRLLLRLLPSNKQ